MLRKSYSAGMTDEKLPELVRRLRDSGISHARIAMALGRAQPAATRLLNGQRSLKASEIEPLQRLLDETGFDDAWRDAVQEGVE